MRQALSPPAEPWRRNLYALRVTGFTAYFGFVFASPLLPLYLRDLLGGEGDVAFWTGITFSVSPLLGALTGPIWGQLADRFGPKRMLLRSLVAIGLAMTLTSFATSPWHVLACRILIGLLGGFTIASIAAVTASTPRREMSAALGSFQAAQTLGLVAGPIIGGLLADAVGARAAFFVSGLCFVPAMLMVHRFYRDIPAGTLDPAETGAEQSVGRASLFQVLAAAPALLLVMGVLYCVNFADAGLGPLMPLLLASAGAPPGNLATVAGATVSAASLGAAVSAYAFGRLGTRMDTGRALLPVLVVGAALAALLGLAQTWWLLAAGRVLLGLVVGGSPALIYAIAAQTGPTSQRGAAMGFVSSFGLLGYASGPLATGAAARISNPAVFATVAAAYLLGALLLAARRLRPRASAP